MTSVTIPRRRLLAAVLAGLAAFGVLILAAQPAAAHATLVETVPADGTTVEAPPERITLRFNEPVTTPQGGIRVFDSAGERVDAGDPARVEGEPAALAVSLDGEVDPGDYVVTWRAISEDGHPIRGAFLFSVGETSGVDDDLVASLFGGDGPLPALLNGTSRAVSYGGTLLAAGGLLFLLVVTRRDEDGGATWVRRAAVVGAVATLLQLPLHTMEVTGFGPLAALAPDALGDTVTSSVGVAAAVRLAALAVLAATVHRLRDAGVAGAAAVAATAGVLSFVFDGHTRTADPEWLMVLGDTVHVATAAAWFGGLVLLVRALRRRRLEDDPVGGARLVGRFSTVATVSILALTVAGGAMSWALIRVPRALVSTTYGWTLLAKVGLAALIMLIGLYNNRRLVPAVERAATPAGGSTGLDTAAGTGTVHPDEGSRTAWRMLRSTVLVEVVGLVVVLGITAGLVNLRPAAEAAGVTGAYEAYEQLTADLELNLVVDPNQAGFNSIHMYILNDAGRPAEDIEDVRIRLTQPERDIGPIEREPFVAGPGHWQLDGRELSLPGEWHVEVIAGIGRFEEASVHVPVFVNPG